jgi:hypothetical protein
VSSCEGSQFTAPKCVSSQNQTVKLNFMPTDKNKTMITVTPRHTLADRQSNFAENGDAENRLE